MVWCTNALEAAKGADVVVALTEWNEFRALDLREVRAVMRGTVLVDLRNIYQADLAEAAGLAYHGIGRPARRASRANIGGDGREPANRPNGAATKLET